MEKSEVTNSQSAIEKAAGANVSLTIPNTAELGKLDEMESDFSLVLKYKTQEEWAELKGKPIRVFFMGLKEIPNDEGEAVNCAVFVSKTEAFISGQMVLVEAVRQLQPKTPIEITYQGKKPNKSTSGSTNIFDIKTLG